MISEKNRTTNIMVVDDTVANLKLLEGILGRRGYRVRSFPRGRLALAAAALEPPDLILLDINIPEMNGYEMCDRLKADPALAPIPVIFISAQQEPMDKVKAFGSGGVDYINKPFQIEEILARVENHVNMRRLQTQLDQHNIRLDETVRLKTRQLAEANERLVILDQAKNDFIMLIAQGLRTPLPGLPEMAERSPAAGSPNGGHAKLTEVFQQSRERLLHLTEDALLLTPSQTDAAHLAPTFCPLSPLLRQAMDQAASQARERHVNLPPVPADLPPVSGSARLMQRALLAVFETAIKFAPKGQTVDVSCAVHADEVHVVLTSGGQALSEDAPPEYGQALATGKPVAPGDEPGLSLALAQRILSLFGGEITTENQMPAGIKLTVRLKTVPAAEIAPKSCA